MEMNNDILTPDLPIPELVEFEDAPIPAPVEEEKPAETPPPRRRRKADAPVLTIESGDEIETEDAREAAAWHEIHNAYRTRRILSAPLGGIEQTDSGKTIAVVDYNGFRIVIPLKEMMVAPSAANSTDSMAVRQMKLLGNMLGAEIDFVILGIDSKSRSVVASRREAMMRKFSISALMPMASTASVRGVWCRLALLPLPTNPSVWRFSAWSVPSWRGIWHGTGSVMPMTALLWATRFLSA